MKAFPIELRERVLSAYEEQGMETSEVAQTFGVSPSWARRLRQRWRESGTIAPLPQERGPAPSLDDADRARLGGLVADTPDATLAELRESLAPATGKPPVSVSTVRRAVRDLGLTLKKSRRVRPSRSGRT